MGEKMVEKWGKIIGTFWYTLGGWYHFFACSNGFVSKDLWKKIISRQKNPYLWWNWQITEFFIFRSFFFLFYAKCWNGYRIAMGVLTTYNMVILVTFCHIWSQNYFFWSQNCRIWWDNLGSHQRKSEKENSVRLYMYFGDNHPSIWIW